MFLKLIDRIGFTPFVIYRLLLGGWLLMYWT
jgi:undecaprenyl pyrophosphate phosphatase UppP